jgi:hypothetical protein
MTWVVGGLVVGLIIAGAAITDNERNIRDLYKEIDRLSKRIK